ncbi:MAG: hypothetical protein IT320_17200 [Anaerolineae bacterium]|nr:hypothetical protein [Anaerolineae bacterium]
MDVTRTLFGGNGGGNSLTVFCCVASALHRFFAATFLALDITCQCVEVTERCAQFQVYLTVIIHDDSFNNLTQQLFLIAALQAIIQRSNPRDNFQRQVEVIDMNLLLLLHGFERSSYGLPTILPFRPHALPNLI